MGGVICQADDRKKNQDIKSEKLKIDNLEEISEPQNKERENSPSKNYTSNYSPKKKETNETKQDTQISNKVTLDTNLLVTRSTNDLKENYKKAKILGQGSFGTVYLVKHKLINGYFAMKVIKKNKNDKDDENIMNEINILRKMDHPNIVKINDFYTTKTEYVLVTEYCPEGELFYEIKNFAPFNEALAGWYMKQILSAVSYCHKLKIIHRDLKPENILIYKKNKNGFNTIKIIDFGTAIIFNKKINDKSLTGSIYYIAPEVLSKNRNYTEKCDVWSCGIIMYILLTGLPPFNGETDEEIVTKIMNGRFNMEKYPWPIISSHAKDLIHKLLEFDSNKRISAEEALNHPWFECKEVKSEDNSGLYKIKNPNKLINNLIKYKSDNVLRCAIIAYLVHNNIQLEQVHEAIKLFNKIDKNGDGQISKEELSKGLENTLKLSGNDLKEKVNTIFNNIDTDHNGIIEYEEFIRAAVDKEYFLSDKFLRFAFNYFDRDRNGQISFNEIKQLFNQSEKNKYNNEIQNQLQQNFQEMDINGDGILSFEEFVQMTKKILKEN
jgi:calcium-dependent protein kinase